MIRFKGSHNTTIHGKRSGLALRAVGGAARGGDGGPKRHRAASAGAGGGGPGTHTQARPPAAWLVAWLLAWGWSPCRIAFPCSGCLASFVPAWLLLHAGLVSVYHFAWFFSLRMACVAWLVGPGCGHDQCTLPASRLNCLCPVTLAVFVTGLGLAIPCCSRRCPPCLHVCMCDHSAWRCSRSRRP
eukprot:COSAG02_NODE_1537_length_12050_cov_219.008116_9_plen_185_part_00